jgi:hypothetical protein
MKIAGDHEAHLGKERSELLILYANKRNRHVRSKQAWVELIRPTYQVSLPPVRFANLILLILCVSPDKPAANL